MKAKKTSPTYQVASQILPNQINSLFLRNIRFLKYFIFHLLDLKASTVRSHLYGLHILVSSAVGTLLLLYV